MITSLQNPLVKRVVGLGEKKRQRDREGVFVIEGEKELLYALANGISIETLLYCPELIGANKQLTTDTAIERQLESAGAQGTELVAVSQQVYGKIAYRQKVGGLAAIARMPGQNIDELKLSANPFILVIHGVEKPGNLGALLRTADGAGVDAVIVCDADVDLFNPNVVRSSLGAVFTVKTFVLSMEQTIGWLAANKIKAILSTPQGDRDYTDIDYTGPTAVVLGSEKAGLPTQWLGQNLCKVKIPMYGQMDSLNVSTSGAILFYEAVRQRKKLK